MDAYMQGYFTRSATLDRRRTPRRATNQHSPQQYHKLNPTYTY